MSANLRYWQSVLREAEREPEAATGNSTLKAAARKLMRAKASLRALDLASDANGAADAS